MQPARSLTLVLLLGVPTLAQESAVLLLAPTPLRSAGTYHVATGTWTRSGPQVLLAPDAIYRNDAPSGYFGTGWEGCWTMDEVMLPGLGNPYAGTADSYRIDGFRFSYCKNGAGTVDWVFGLYESYTPCDSPDWVSCTERVTPLLTVPGLPGGSACWTVTVDFGQEYCAAADGGPCAPGYQGQGLLLDHGGVGFAWSTSDGGTAGPVLAGDPRWKPRGEGTCYLPAFSNACGASDATGLGAQDLFGFGNAEGFTTGCSTGWVCTWFGGHASGSSCSGAVATPFASFDLTLYADCTADCYDPCWSNYCGPSQNPNNAALLVLDTCDSSAPTNRVTMKAGPPGQFAYLLAGNGMLTVSQPPGSVGDLCVAGGSCLGRYDKDLSVTDASGSAWTDLANAVSTPCNGGVTITPGSTWNFQYWHRQPMGAPSTFSRALAASFH